jgi:hypothetical protein
VQILQQNLEVQIVVTRRARLYADSSPSDAHYTMKHAKTAQDLAKSD